MINLTSPRADLLEQMLYWGPQSYAHVHWSWLKDLRVLQRNGLVAYRKGMWRATRKGRDFYVQRTGRSWETIKLWQKINEETRQRADGRGMDELQGRRGPAST